MPKSKSSDCPSIKSCSVSDISSSAASLKNVVKKGVKAVLRPFKRLWGSPSICSHLSLPSHSSLAPIPDDDKVIDVNNDDILNGQPTSGDLSHLNDEKSIDWEKELGMYMLNCMSSYKY
jgi:hypothetical protein